MGRRMLQPLCVFDFDQFRTDLLAYIDRQRLSRLGLAQSIGMTPGSINGFLNHQRRTVGHDALMSLAWVADLDLNRYVIHPEHVDRGKVPSCL